jgi:hypothetical protein
MIETKSNITYIELEKIRLDGGTQPRTEIDESVVDEYAELMQGGTVFPPIIVFSDRHDYWLADGFHRWHAAKKIGRETISAEVRYGSQRDAILYSLGANSSHGLRRTNADKRKAVETLLNDETWQQWSGNEIARRCGVSEFMVRQVRAAQPSIKSKSENNSRTYKTRHGTEATMKTSEIGAKSNSGKSRKVKKRLAGIRSGLTQNPETSASDIFGVMGLGYCQALVRSLEKIVMAADARKGAGNE